MTDKITMNGQWAHRRDPFTEVEVWTPKNKPGVYVVYSCDTKGVIRSHTVYGFYSASNAECGSDLIPLKRKPREWWVNFYEDGWSMPHRTQEAAEAAEAGAGGAGLCIETVHVREVLD